MAEVNLLSVSSSLPGSVSKQRVKLLAPLLIASLTWSEDILLPPVATILSTPLAVAERLSSSPSTITTSFSTLMPERLKKPPSLSSPGEFTYFGVDSPVVLNLKPFT